LGIAICMGDRASALEEANRVLADYRRNISKYLGWVMEKPERMRELEHIYLVYGETFINEKIIGTISSILVSGLENPEKPLIAFSNIEEENAAKFSARTTDAALSRGVNLGEVMRVASEKYGGKGGGHNVAAGAQVPIDQVENFINAVNELVAKQLKGEEIGSNDNS
jgi:single-stranded-DNA-specific exonuclease